MSLLEKLLRPWTKAAAPASVPHETIEPAEPRPFVTFSEIDEVPDALVAIGEFSVVSGKLLVCDTGPHPDFKDLPPSLDPSQSLFVNAADGTWRAFVSFTPENDGRPSALIVQHESQSSHPDRALSADAVASLVVEGGRVAIADLSVCDDAELCKDFDYGPTESTISDIGCQSQSGWGDGTYPVLGERENGKVISLAVVFAG